MKWWRARSRRTQAILIIVGLIALYGMVGGGSAQPSDVASRSGATSSPASAPATAQPTAAPTVAPTPSPTPTPVPTPAPTPVVIRGTGQTATEEIRLPSALSAATFTHRGARNFAVWAFRGDTKDLLVNTIGAYEGVRGLFGDAPVRLSIEADGAWTATIAAIESGGSAAVSGRGDAVSRIFEAPGTGSFRFTHGGTRNFAIWLYCASGRQLIQNTIGAFDGSKIVQFGRGPCLWEVTADGAWSIAPQ